MENKKVECNYKGLAKSISRHVSSLEEVDFNKSSLTTKLAKEWKKKPDRKLRSKLESWWASSCALRCEVERILTGKASLTCTNNDKSQDMVADDSHVSQCDVSSKCNLDIPSAACTDGVQRAEGWQSEADFAGDHLTRENTVDFDECMFEDLASDGVNAKMVGENSVADTTHTNLREFKITESARIPHKSDATSCVSINSTPSSNNLVTTRFTYSKKHPNIPLYSEPPAASIYDFSDSDGERVNSNEIRKPSPHREDKYKIDLGEVLVYSARFKNSDGIVTNDAIRRGLRVVLATEYRCTCTLRFTTIRMNEADFVAYARCMSVEHKQCFKFHFFGLQQVRASVFAVSSDQISFTHEKRSFSQLRGADRQAVKNALKTMPPRNYQMDVGRNIDSALAADGNMQDLKRLYVYQKAKSEENCKDDVKLQSADLSDLFQHWMNQDKEKDPYLRHVSLPLTAIMFTEAQLNLLEHSKGLVLHLDATGSVVRKPPGLNCKRIYYYVLVTKHNESVIPVAEMVTSEHDIKSISTFLKTYKFFVQEKLRTWPFVSAVVVDWSWALLNSLLSEWNQMNITDYLNMAYSFVMEGRKPKNIIIVQTCCAHFMKRMSTIIKKDFSQHENVKAFLLECIALMMLCREITELDCIFEHFVNAVSTPDKDDAASSLHALQKIVAERKFELNEIHDQMRDEDEKQKPKSDLKSLKKSKAVFANSPFFVHFNNKFDRLTNNINAEKSVTNKYYVPGFARQMTWKHMAYAPLWTSLMLDLVDKNISRLSNAYVESYHKVIKHHVLDHHKNLKIGHFIRKTESYTRTLLIEANLEVSLKSKEPSTKPKYPITDRKNVIDPQSKRCNVNHDLDCNNVAHTVSPADNKAIENVDVTNVENPYSDEVSDPLIREVWKDTKKATRARGHFQGNVLGRMLTEINKKSRKAVKKTDHFSEPETEHVDLISSTHGDDVKHGDNTDSSVKEKLNILPNGLFDDVEYYMQSKSHNVRIACFVATLNPPIRSNCFQLTARQFHTLTPNRWVDGLVIDCYSMSHIDTWKDAMYLSTDDTGSILGHQWEKRKPASCGIYNITRTLSGKILMPYVHYGHWRLLVVDIDDKTLTLLDPYKNTKADEARVYDAFNKFLEFSDGKSTVSELRRIQWTMTNEMVRPRPYQSPNDGSNCGVYVAHYVECVAKNEPFDLAFDPLDFRRQMAQTIIKQSVNLQSMCLYCFGQQYENSDVTLCVACHNWCHVHCVDKGEYDSEMEEYDDDQLNRFKKRSKNTGKLAHKKLKTNDAGLQNDFTCKLCKRRKI